MLPVPAYSVLLVVSNGSKASELMDSDGMLSVSTTQLGWSALALVVRHTPPLTVPTYTVFGSPGFTAMADTAPAKGLVKAGSGPCAGTLIPPHCELCSAVGPMLVQSGRFNRS